MCAVKHHPFKTISHEIAEGCRLQILQDIEHRENPYKLLLLAAEAISRLDYKGDTFFLQVRKTIMELSAAEPAKSKSRPSKKNPAN